MPSGGGSGPALHLFDTQREQENNKMCSGRLEVVGFTVDYESQVVICADSICTQFK